ncbi:hypothetical protein Nlim_0943 [Candidatus Nitrosarchaeum limnium SFB1]|jgi:hypothetical protein|uniref:Uncharacterized protein n=1 Tax=Candidatus Nitrosarchaeum limnium SFB1 TaxID=886738 RepID=F3KKC8_9ARCH|nr:hypothetical protein Nlim_0943 [Candidatus Nitrosarchaeum limnium SFB1]
MGKTCREICVDSKGIPMSNSKRYENGQKRCTFCGLFLETSEVRCSCCKGMLRTKSRGKKLNYFSKPGKLAS